MLKNIGKSLTSSISGSLVGKAVKWGFWTTLVLFGPGTVVAAIGVQSVMIVGIAAHSGLVEYTTSKIIDYKLN